MKLGSDEHLLALTRATQLLLELADEQLLRRRASLPVDRRSTTEQELSQPQSQVDGLLEKLSQVEGAKST